MTNNDPRFGMPPSFFGPGGLPAWMPQPPRSAPGTPTFQQQTPNPIIQTPQCPPIYATPQHLGFPPLPRGTPPNTPPLPSVADRLPQVHGVYRSNKLGVRGRIHRDNRLTTFRLGFTNKQ